MAWMALFALPLLGKIHGDGNPFAGGGPLDFGFGGGGGGGLFDFFGGGGGGDTGGGNGGSGGSGANNGGYYTGTNTTNTSLWTVNSSFVS